MKFLRLKALGLVVLLFLGVYVPTFVVVGMIKPKPQAAIPLIIGLSLAIALTLIWLLHSRTDSFSQFGFKGSSYGYV